MAKLNPDSLVNALKRQLKPIYLVSGDETLLVNESCLAIRREANSKGYSQHEIFHAEGQFNWDAVLQSINALSLFADKKILEIRIPKGKLGDAGSKTIKEFCSLAPEDIVMVLVLPKLDKKSENTAWYKTVNTLGDCITVWPIGAQQLPRWIEARLHKSGLRAEHDAISILCAKVEGNLLAAVQEIEKLKLLADENSIIDAAMMASSVMDSSRYNAFDLIDKALSGNARATVECLSGLKSEGTSAPVLLWALANQIRTLLQIKEVMQSGLSFENAASQARIWKSKMAFTNKAQSRLNTTQLSNMLRKCAFTDKVIKGLAKGDEWNELLDISLKLAGIEALNKRSQKLSFQAARA